MSGVTDRLQAMADQAAQKNGIDAGLFRALITQESGWQPKVTSHAGALGLGQLMPSTAKALGVSNPLDPQQNLDASARYFKQQLDRFGGDQRLALAAYNAGPAAVAHYGDVPPFPETQSYVQKILGAAGQHSAGGGAISWDNPSGGAAPARGTAPASISWDNPDGTAKAPVRITELQGKTKANLTGLSPGVQTALSGAADDLAKQGLDIGPLITSGFRSSADQARLYQNRANNPNPVAPPGHSAHESGNAIDIAVHHLPANLQQTVLSTLAQYGLTRPMASDPVHFQLGSAPKAASAAPAQISWANPG